MKKLTIRRLNWFLARQKNETRRSRSRRRKLLRVSEDLFANSAIQQQLIIQRVSSPEQKAAPPQFVYVRQNRTFRRELIIPPETFSLRGDYDNVVSFFQHLRDRAYNIPPTSASALGVDFRSIKKITPGAALVLAAELYRWQIFTQRKLVPVLQDDWDPLISRMLRDFGLFEFLETPDQRPEPSPSEPPFFKFIKYRSGVGVTPTACSDLLDHLSAIVGSIEAEKFIFDGLVEALNNVKHHAYPDNSGWHGVSSGTWLMCGAYSERAKVLTAAVYDMGVGIPATLPRSGLWEQIKGILAAFGANDDSSMIAAAMQAGRTRTGQVERGKGLPIMMRLFDHVRGHLRILSGHGEVRYTSGASEIGRIGRPLSLGGTLIQWQISKV
ncbi:hypothetical protein [Mesorhizobium sp. M1027]|uniref:hypothetical protein n=1 Tax=Mesorhizobium sp. M1027 TaxID=2957050 RepID=UPI003339944E